MTVAIYSILLFILVLIFTLFVLHRCIKLERLCKKCMVDCVEISKTLDNDRGKLFSAYQDAKAEHKAYRIMREKLEKHLTEGIGRFVSVAELHTDQRTLHYLDPEEAGMLYNILSKLKSQEVIA